MSHRSLKLAVHRRERDLGDLKDGERPNRRRRTLSVMADNTVE